MKHLEVHAREPEVLKLARDVRSALNTLGKPYKDSSDCLAKSLKTLLTARLSKERAEVAKTFASSPQRCTQDLLEVLLGSPTKSASS